MKKWYYANARCGEIGLMVCTACQKDITSGDFRYRTTEEAHLPQHRHCSLSDEMWIKIDEERKARLLKYERELKEYNRFKDKHETESLDEDIRDIKESISELKELDK